MYCLSGQVDDMILCDGIYGLGAYGMESVHGTQGGKGGDRERVGLGGRWGGRPVAYGVSRFYL